MEAKINIAEILKDKPQGTRLYSPIFGECAFSLVREETDDICVKKHNGEIAFFDSKGLYNTLGECLLFPSRKMRDWSKFSWKKGDVLVNNYSGTKVIFDEWYDDSYTSFNAKHYLDSEDETEIVYHEEFLCATERYSLEDKDAAQTYISAIEKILGGKLNRETLEIEKAQPEFKDGDIVTMHKKNCDIVFIFNRLRTEGSFYYYAFHALQTNNTGVIDCHTTLPCAWTFFEGKMNFATDSEKQQLFGALAKEGKAWDAKKKMLVDLKPKIEFKPFDKVLVRNTDTEEWFPGFFEKFDRTWNYPYHIMNLRSMTNFSFKQCIPYEGNEHLLGTTKDVEG